MIIHVSRGNKASLALPTVSGSEILEKYVICNLSSVQFKIGNDLKSLGGINTVACWLMCRCTFSELDQCEVWISNNTTVGTPFLLSYWSPELTIVFVHTALHDHRQSLWTWLFTKIFTWKLRRTFSDLRHSGVGPVLSQHKECCCYCVTKTGTHS